MTTGFCLDAGALIAVDRGERRVISLLDRAVAAGASLEVPATVVAQVWRDGSHQARLARFLNAREVITVDLDAQSARAVGVMCGAAGIPDVVDGHVALHARRRGLAVLTSDAGDIARLDPTLVIIEV
ncbi:PIN domain nuclease [Nocardioides zhouii]|uniref:PIN domain nuclease n=1 Tax=Nocardioides zhouii TaxID=1168729 RepID=A0A4V1RPT6_9ACTN|nr:PIN domain nuclease [Nocardioides zhouii]RYC10487.1 PIN domain nuclease [Nocardioides zhouii]